MINFAFNSELFFLVVPPLSPRALGLSLLLALLLLFLTRHPAAF